jgi:hypothetical protein
MDLNKLKFRLLNLNRPKPWNQCDYCGKFIKYGDFHSTPKRAICGMVTPLSDVSDESWETFHITCSLK